MALRYYQREANQAVFDYWSETPGNPLVVSATGCHASGTQILMYDGTTKPVEMVAENDNLMGPDSKPRRVLRTVSGKEMMYRVTPTKGEPFVVNEGHILSLKITSQGEAKAKFPSGRTAGQIENVRLSDWLNKAKYWKHLRKLWRAGVDFKYPANDNLPVPAYIVGAMLGDGSMTHQVGITNMDAEVLDEVCDYAESLGVRVRVTKKPNNQAWGVFFPDDEANKVTRNRFVSRLEEAGVWGMICDQKAIPHTYKAGSRETRLEVLAGLLDTDGHLSGGSHFDFISKSESLSRDVTFVARSLGLAAYVNPCEKYCQTGGGGTYWRVSISGDVEIIPNRVERQKASPRRQKKNPLVTGFSATPIGVGDYYGFALDGDNLYLTADFTVHHNTGKSIMQASLTCDLLDGWSDLRVMNTTHVVELVESNFKELVGLRPFAPTGIWAASLGRQDRSAQVLFSQIQTVHDKAEAIGHVDVLQIDEAHLVPFKQATMYRRMIDALLVVNPDMKINGFTATDFRLDGGRLTEGEGRLFDEVVYDYGLRRGIDDGYLTPITSKPVGTKYDTTGVGRSMGEYKASDYREAVDTESLNRRVVEEVLDTEGHRNKALIFCRGVEHAGHIRDEFQKAGRAVELVHGGTPKGERRRTIERLKSGELWGVVNDNILSTGTNIVGADLLVDLYRTMSASRYVQRAGRLTRVIYPPWFDPEAVEAEARRAAIASWIKPNGRYMDFAGNINEHGPVDMVQPKKPDSGQGEAPIKLCPNCDEICHASARVCHCCGTEFVFEEKPKFAERASDAPIISTQVDMWRKVTSRRLAQHTSSKTGKTMIKITLMAGFLAVTEFAGPSHVGFLKNKADRFWKTHGGSLPYPKTEEEYLLRQHELMPTAEVEIVYAGKYANVKDVRAAADNDNEPQADNDNDVASEEYLDDFIPF
jgi:DNA repair protein RadD